MRRLYRDYDERDLLRAVRDIQDRDGHPAITADVCEAIGGADTRAVGGALSWARGQGYLTSEFAYRITYWMITEKGREWLGPNPEEKP